jgi:hypothetical protein
MLALALVTGAVARIALLDAKPFWRDEAWVATLAGQPLWSTVADQRPVPVGFLALVKLGGLVPGLPPEVGLRLVPLAVSLVLPLVVAALAFRLGAPTVGLVAAWLVAAAPPLVYYGRELKHYELDALLAAAVPLLALRATTPAGAAGLAATLVAAPWVAFASVFAIVPTLAWTWWRVGRRRWLVIVSLLFLASFAAAWMLAAQSQAASGRIARIWNWRLIRMQHPADVVSLGWAAVVLCRTSFTSLFREAWPAAVPLALLGAVAWPRGHRAAAVWLWAGTVATTLAAAVVGRWVLWEGRLLLVVAPATLLLVAAGLVRVGTWIRSPRAVPIAVAAALALAWTTIALRHRLHPPPNDPRSYFVLDVLHDIEPILAIAHARRAPDEPVLVTPFTSQPYWFYGRGRLPGALACRASDCSDTIGYAAGWAAKVSHRGWVIVLENDEEQYVRAALEKAGLSVYQEATARGMRLWEVVRSPANALAPPR